MSKATGTLCQPVNNYLRCECVRKQSREKKGGGQLYMLAILSHPFLLDTKESVEQISDAIITLMKFNDNIISRNFFEVTHWDIKF